MTPKRPDLNVCIKHNNKWEQVGAAWTNESGQVRVVLNPFVQLPPGASFNLFPNKDNTKPTKSERSSTYTKPESFDEDVPF